MTRKSVKSRAEIETNDRMTYKLPFWRVEMSNMKLMCMCKQGK